MATQEEKKLMQDSMEKLRQGNLDEADKGFKKFIELYPQSDLADNACYNLAMIQLKRNQKQKALEWLNYLLNTYPTSDAAYMAKDEQAALLKEMGLGPTDLPDELYQKGKSAVAQGNMAEGIRVFQEFLEKFSDSDLIDNVHYNLALIFRHQKNQELVRKHVEIIMKQYPDSDAAVYAAELLEDEE